MSTGAGRETERGWNKGGLEGALLTDLSKVFDYIKYDLLIAKLAAYGFDSHSLSFIFSYLNERKQMKKLHNSYNPYAHIAHGVPRGLILGSLLLNTNICDMFFEKYECDIAKKIYTSYEVWFISIFRRSHHKSL